MYRAVGLGIFLLLTSFSANASFIEKLSKLGRFFKGEHVAEKAVEAGRAGTAVGAGEHSPPVLKAFAPAHTNGVVDFSAVNNAPKAFDVTPNYASVVSGRRPQDVEIYKSLRAKAVNGDGDALLKMSDLTRSGKITDPGEPYYGYWLFQAIRTTNALGASSNSPKSAKTKAQDVCKNETDVRRSNRLFDDACSSLDNKIHFPGAGGSPQIIEQIQKRQTISTREK